MKTTFQLILCYSLLIFSLIGGQSINDLDVNDIEKKINEIPGLEKFNSSSLPNEEDLEKVLKEKCEKNGGGEAAFEALKNQQSTLQTCIEQYINTTQFQLEIEEAKKTGSMDEVLGKYCKKYPDIYNCFENVTEQIKLCMDDREKDAMDKVLNITGELREFLCYKDGDRIAMFIAEGGVECFEERKDALQDCANHTLGSRIPTELSLSSMPTFIFSDRDCNDFETLRTCFIKELEKCKDSTPANIMEALFKFLKKHTPCNNFNSSNTKMLVASSTNNSSTIQIYSFMLLAVLFMSQYF